MMRRVGLIVSGAVVMAATACGGSGGGGESSSVAYGARTCSDWAGRMDEGERWDAAEELLVNAKSVDGSEGDLAPSTRMVAQFAVDLGAMCERGPGDEFLAVVADELYALNPAGYSL